MTTNKNFKDLLFRAGFYNFGKFDRQGATEFLHTTERTLDRWIKTNKPCPRALALLEDRLAGGIQQNGSWNGFFISRGGDLWTPEGRHYSPEFLSRLDILQRTSRFHESEANSLKEEVKHLRKLVGARDRLKEMGSELINIADRLRFDEVMRRFEGIDDKESA